MRFIILQEINIAQITILQLFKSKQVKSWFLMRGENYNREKASQTRVENQQTQSTYMTPSAEIEPRARSHWWKASAPTTRPTLPPI